MTLVARHAPAPAPGLARPDVRRDFRELLTAQPGFRSLDPNARRDLAAGLVKIGSIALNNEEAAGRAKPLLAYAKSAGSEYSGTAINRMAGTAQAVLNAVSFPRFVTELITGVFKAMNDSNQQQLTAFVDLIRNVAQTTEGFADSNVGISGARQWLAEHFPAAYQVAGAGDTADDAEELAGLPPDERAQRKQEMQAERDAQTRLEMRPGATPPSEAALRGALGLGASDALSPSNPETLVPLAQQVLARNRQQLLATMVQMGLQRIVIESGRLNAAMNFHIDASSVAANDRGSSFDTRNSVGVSGGARFGPWGAEANVQSTIGYVSTDRTQTTESSHADLNLSSAVELVFRTDYVPLSRLAGVGDVERIRVNTLNPDAESARITADRAAQRSADQAEMTARSAQLDSALRPPPPLPAATPGSASGSAARTSPNSPAKSTTPSTPTTTPKSPASKPTATKPTASTPTATTPAETAAKDRAQVVATPPSGATPAPPA